MPGCSATPAPRWSSLNRTPRQSACETEILALLDDPERRARMANAARTVARPDAAARLADELLSLARQRWITVIRR